MNLVGLIGISLALGVLSWLGFLWSVRSGQYEDPEGPKYRMLDDDDVAPLKPSAAPQPGTAPAEVPEAAVNGAGAPDPATRQTPDGP